MNAAIQTMGYVYGKGMQIRNQGQSLRPFRRPIRIGIKAKATMAAITSPITMAATTYPMGPVMYPVMALRC
jgi:hypothetical protein